MLAAIELDSLIPTNQTITDVVYTTGNQTLNGVKTLNF
jgi:hypothetical protein